MIDKDIFCSTPYTMVMIQPDGSYRMCCLTNNSDYNMGGCMTDDGQLMTVFTHTLKEALNSKWHKDVRKAHAESRRHALCNVCYNRDDISGNSRRNYVSNVIPLYVDGYVTNETAGRILNGMEVTEDPIALDLRFGNLCNLKCVTCGPWYSDKWIDEYREFYGGNSYTFGGATIDSPKSGKIINIRSQEQSLPWWETDTWWKMFEEIIPTLKHLYITGGEPMIVPAHDIILDKLVTSGFARNIVIEIDTNFTALNPKVMQHWSAFKRVDLRISTDDVYDRYELFRYPAKWSKFKRNIETVTKSTLGNINPMLTTCITPLNLFSIDDIVNFSNTMGIKNAPHFRFVEKPTQLDIRFLTKLQKDYAINILSTQQSEWANKVIRYLTNHYDTENSAEQSQFIKFFDFLDKSRGQNWKTVYPAVANMFSDKYLNG